MTGTMLVRQQQAVTTLLGSHVTAYDPASQAMFAQTRRTVLLGTAFTGGNAAANPD
jgi:hypothetical protein